MTVDVEKREANGIANNYNHCKAVLTNINMAISVACLVSQHLEFPCSVVCVVTGT